MFLQGVCWNCVLLGGVTGASDKDFGEMTVSPNVIDKTWLGSQPDNLLNTMMVDGWLR